MLKIIPVAFILLYFLLYFTVDVRLICLNKDYLLTYWKSQTQQ